MIKSHQAQVWELCTAWRLTNSLTNETEHLHSMTDYNVIQLFPQVCRKGRAFLEGDLAKGLGLLWHTPSEAWAYFLTGCEWQTKKLNNSFKGHQITKIKLALSRLWISSALTQWQLWGCGPCGWKTDIKSLPLWLFVTQNSEDLRPELSFFFLDLVPFMKSMEKGAGQCAWIHYFTAT